MDRGVSVSLWCEEVEGDQSRGPSSQLRAPWDPTVSGHRVIQRLLRVEERYAPSALYVTLIQREPERREELAKWALEVGWCCSGFSWGGGGGGHPCRWDTDTPPPRTPPSLSPGLL